MIGEHTEEEASLYVLGLLPREEAGRFEAAIASDAELAALVGRLETGAAAFAWTAPPRDPPEALRDRIMDRIRADEPGLAKVLTPFPSRHPGLPWALAACLALFLGWSAYDQYHMRLIVDAFKLRDGLQQMELDRVQTRQAALQNRLAAALALVSADGKQIADLNARNALSEVRIAALSSMVKDAPQAMAVIAWDGAAQRGIVKTLNLPAARSDQDYQLWIIDPGYKQPVSAGVFDPAKGANFGPLHPISKAGKFAVSLEKKGGSPAPQGPVVLVGE